MSNAELTVKSSKLTDDEEGEDWADCLKTNLEKPGASFISGVSLVFLQPSSGARLCDQTHRNASMFPLNCLIRGDGEINEVDGS